MSTTTYFLPIAARSHLIIFISSALSITFIFIVNFFINSLSIVPQQSPYFWLFIVRVSAITTYRWQSCSIIAISTPFHEAPSIVPSTFLSSSPQRVTYIWSWFISSYSIRCLSFTRILNGVKSISLEFYRWVIVWTW